MTAATEERLTRGPRRPSVWARGVVWVATCALPRGEIRDRYRHEFTADLHVLSPGQQGAYASGVLATALALRSAVSGERSTTEEVVVKQQTPLSCRLNLRHVWHTFSTEDGSNRYQECVRCGKPRPQSDHFIPVG